MGSRKINPSRGYPHFSDWRARKLNVSLLSVKDAEEILSLGHTKVCELIADGDLKSIKIGRRRLIPQVAIEEFICERLAKASPRNERR
jgi:excisionase family DNA binding protein